MKCQACHKSEATVAYTHVVGDEKKTVYLCSVCTSQKKAAEPIEAAAPPTGGDPVLVKKVKVELKHLAKTDGPSTVQCPKCGMNYEEFKKIGRLGCHVCYEAFDAQLERLLKRIHGAVQHRGKGLVEKRVALPPEQELEKLREELRTAVVTEAFEKAAELRDRIQELEAELDGDTPEESGESERR